MDSDPTDTRVAKFDVTVPHPARMYNYYLGGKDNFAADRVAAEELVAAMPDGVLGPVPSCRFLERVVRVMASEYGIRRFIDLGTGIPIAPTVHDIAKTYH